MSSTIITSFSNTGYHEYGKRFIETFQKFWPTEVKLVVYHEGIKDLPFESYNLYKVPACFDFLTKHASDKVVKGQKQKPEHRWKARAIEAGYNFRFDAYKFCRKVFALNDARQKIKSGKMFWLDADVVTTSTVPTGLLNTLLGDSDELCRLYRGSDYHSECGFVGYNLDKEIVHHFLQDFADLFTTGKVFQLPEWHDSWVFDYLVDQYSGSMNVVNIPSSSKSHIFNFSMLGRYMDHLKGPERKAMGYSKERIAS